MTRRSFDGGRGNEANRTGCHSWRKENDQDILYAGWRRDADRDQCKDCPRVEFTIGE